MVSVEYVRISGRKLGFIFSKTWSRRGMDLWTLFIPWGYRIALCRVYADTLFEALANYPSNHVSTAIGENWLRKQYLLQQWLIGHDCAVFLQYLIDLLDDISLADSCSLWIQLEGAPARIHSHVREWLDRTMDWTWSFGLRLPDLMPVDFFSNEGVSELITT